MRLDPLHGLLHAPGMASIDQLQETERRMLELLEDNDLPQPDHVEYGEACIRLFWHDRKLMVIVDDIE